MVVVPSLVGVLANARHLPAGRSRARDRHLKIHDYRDNLGAIRRDAANRLSMDHAMIFGTVALKLNN
jgi:hypothetical protein